MSSASAMDVTILVSPAEEAMLAKYVEQEWETIEVDRTKRSDGLTEISIKFLVGDPWVEGDWIQSD